MDERPAQELVKANPELKILDEELFTDVYSMAVQKGNTELLNFVNDEIVKLGKDNFFHKDYQETLEPVYGNEVNPDDIVVEGGAV